MSPGQSDSGQIPIEEEKEDTTDVSMSPVLKKRRTSIHSHKNKMNLSEISLNTGVIETSTAQNLVNPLD